MLKVIILVYFLIGIFKTGILFLHPPSNQPLAIRRLQLGYILAGIILWLPFLVSRMIQVGIRIAVRYEIDSITTVILYRVFGRDSLSITDYLRNKYKNK